MTQDLISSAPGVYSAFLGLVQTAAAQQNPAVQVYAFELGEYVPGQYVTVHAIENHEWQPETIGTFSQTESYDIVGCAVVYSGDSPNTNPSVATTVLNQTYSLFQNCVMTPVMSNRTIPILGTTGPSPYQVLPGYTRYTAGPGEMVGGESGWYGLISFGYTFNAYITPA